MNAVIKSEHIETIFDHGVTQSEMNDLLGAEESHSDYYSAISIDEAYADLYFLYEIRNNHAQAIVFLNKISDENYRNHLINRCTH